MSKGEKLIVMFMLLFLLVIIAVFDLDILGFRIVHDPSLNIDWVATGAVGTILSVITTTFLGIAAIYISKQANELVKKQDEIAQKKNSLAEVEKMISSVNFILSYNFIYKNTKVVHGTSWRVVKNLYNSEIMSEKNILLQNQSLFHQKGIVESNHPYYKYVYDEFDKIYGIINNSSSFQEAYDELMKRNIEEIAKYIGLGIGFISIAEIKLFGIESFEKNYPGRTKEANEYGK